MKKIIVPIILLLVLLAAIAHFQFYADPDIEELNLTQKYFAGMILSSFETKLTSIPAEERAIIDYYELLSSLNHLEKDLAERILLINPASLGFKGPFFSKEKPQNLIKIQSQKVGERETGINYSPELSYNDYITMNRKMKEEIGKELYIDSGYRSPGRQAYLFFYYLVNSNNYSLTENAKWIAMPGYSEHGHPVNNALDFTSSSGINGFHKGQTSSDFESLDEFKWLLKNANSYNFYMTYPRNNAYGVAYEPWHWHWEK
jgi:hypothetical protein